MVQAALSLVPFTGAKIMVAAVPPLQKVQPSRVEPDSIYMVFC